MATNRIFWDFEGWHSAEIAGLVRSGMFPHAKVMDGAKPLLEKAWSASQANMEAKYLEQVVPETPVDLDWLTEYATSLDGGNGDYGAGERLLAVIEQVEAIRNSLQAHALACRISVREFKAKQDEAEALRKTVESLQRQLDDLRSEAPVMVYKEGFDSFCARKFPGERPELGHWLDWKESMDKAEHEFINGSGGVDPKGLVKP